MIDTRHRGRERAISVWDLGGVIVDPGPERCIETLLAEISGEPKAVLLTHIHLDHAAATGALVRRFPELDVYVHERGAPHVIDPTKLLASAGRLYGDQMGELWGEIVPVPERNVTVLAGGESLVVEGLEIDVTYTPGHASHHVTYLEGGSGIAYVGDVAGVRIPPADFVMAPTPPPDIDVELWQDSIELVRAMRPTKLALTHFGMVDDVEGHLDRVAEALDRQSEVARELVETDASSEEARVQFVEKLSQTLREASDDETAATAIAASPPEQLWLGLDRYWRKRVAAGAS